MCFETVALGFCSHQFHCFSIDYAMECEHENSIDLSFMYLEFLSECRVVRMGSEFDA